MFNPYAIRPIGSNKFFEHLKDIQTDSYYQTELAYCFPIISNGTIPWKESQRKALDGYDELYLAIIAMGFIDYLYAYYQKTMILEDEGQTADYWVWNSKCIDLENYWFRNSDTLSYCFDKMLENVCWNGLDAIEACMKRFESFLRWTKRPKSKMGRNN